ncbi:hypothetical protein QEZ47_02405 [Aminobacter anthyllidis]|uniref:hypothetical protein n=1 Tax=Aminobacter anthyllidis TaxID=1035067 RepID=UPI002459100A|nr:hypothetical protein [Aminobacter anthyllidis]MDH4984430.1 hypothetical protein [Aminobacter anthyllidis]
MGGRGAGAGNLGDQSPQVRSHRAWPDDDLADCSSKFTGKKLDDYIKGERCDYVCARRIVNGTDRDDDLAKYAQTFEAALRAANYLGVAPQPRPTIPEPKPDPAPAPEPARGWLSRVFAWLFS